MQRRSRLTDVAVHVPLRVARGRRRPDFIELGGRLALLLCQRLEGAERQVGVLQELPLILGLDRADAMLQHELDVVLRITEGIDVTHYRAGRFDGATESFNQSINTDPRWAGVACNWFGLAMAYQCQGKASEARRWLEKGLAWIEQNDPRKPGRPVAGVSALHTQDWAGGHVLRNEVEKLIHGK